MTSDPVDLALREIAETERLLQALITASESFDYLRAKRTLQELKRKVRTLSKLRTEVSRQRPLAPNIIPLETLIGPAP